MAETMDVSRIEIDAVPEVEFTKTWRPVHHRDIIGTVDRQLGEMGLEPLSENFQLSKDGKDLFATMGLRKVSYDNPDQRGNVMLGFRNSMKKNFSLGFVAGERITVCSNMQFYGEFQDFHRHNSQLTQEKLAEFTHGAIDTVLDSHGVHRAWFDTLAAIEIDDTDMKALTFDVMDAGIVAPSRFKRFRNDYRQEVMVQRDFAYEHTLAHFNGAVTRHLRSESINQQMRKTRQLKPMLDSYVDVEDLFII